jgi:hypothetical protein
VAAGQAAVPLGVKNPLPIRPAATARKRGPLQGPARRQIRDSGRPTPSLRHASGDPFLILIDALFRIASPEMFPEAEMLPRLICSRPMFIGGANDEADQHGGA